MSDATSEPGLLTRLFSRSTSEGTPESEDEDSPSGRSAQHQELMMNAAERFHLLRVDDVMVPRANIVAVENGATLTELSQALKDAGHSRLPVYKESGSISPDKPFHHLHGLHIATAQMHLY